MATELSHEELHALVIHLSTRLADLEAQVAEMNAEKPIPEDVMVAISAAVSAYLGYQPTIKAVSFRQGKGWQQEGRGRVHNRQVLHVR